MRVLANFIPTHVQTVDASLFLANAKPPKLASTYVRGNTHRPPIKNEHQIGPHMNEEIGGGALSNHANPTLVFVPVGYTHHEPEFMKYILHAV